MGFHRILSAGMRSAVVFLSLLVLPVCNGCASDAIRAEGMKASIPRQDDQAGKTAILDLVDTIVARRDLKDISLIEKSLKVGSYKRFEHEYHVSYIIYPGPDSPMIGDASVRWRKQPDSERVQQTLSVSLDRSRVCLTLDDLSERYGEGNRERQVTHPPAHRDHPFASVGYRFGGIVSLGVSFNYQTCARSFVLSVLRSH